MKDSSVERFRRWVLPALARYFRLELVGAVGSIPDWERTPCIFVMNHTAILGLEVYLFHAVLDRLRPRAALPRTTVWQGFLKMPAVGAFYRKMGCIEMSLDGAAGALRAGQSILVLPEGPDATDVRYAIKPFHAGFLRVVRALQPEREVVVVPLGWAGVDEANPWWWTTRPLLVRLLMKPFMPRFDFALIPRPPLLRPSKVVFVAGEPLRFSREDLAGEPRLRHEVEHVRDIVIGLAEQAASIRGHRIDDSPAERLLHRVTHSRDIAWQRTE